MIPQHVIDLKKQRATKCVAAKCRKNHGGFFCGPCRRLGKALCKKYHILTLQKETSNEAPRLAAQEIAARLTYEYVFDILDEETLDNGRWMERGLRDAGHTTRMQLLCKYAKQYVNVGGISEPFWE